MRCAVVGVVLLAGCHLVFPLGDAPDGGPGSEALRHRTITITNPTGSELDAFPVRIAIENDADLRDHARSDGTDLRFLVESSVELPKEIVRFDKTTGTLEAWVRVPVLGLDDTTITLEYGGDPAP